MIVEISAQAGSFQGRFRRFASPQAPELAVFQFLPELFPALASLRVPAL
jgi:hypothetical protein